MAQFGSASGLGPEGRRFESYHSDHLFKEPYRLFFMYDDIVFMLDISDMINQSKYIKVL